MVGKIVVAGDVTIDWLQWDIKPKDEQENFSPNWELYSGYHMTALAGGAKLLADMMENALTNNCECLLKKKKDENQDTEEFEAIKNVHFDIISQELDPRLRCIPPNDIIHSITMLGEYKCPKKDDPEKKLPKKVYRVKEFRGFSGPEGEFQNTPTIVNDDENAGMVILDDAGNGFRYTNEKAWPLAIQKDKNPIVILKMSRPLSKNNLWNKLEEKHADNLVVVLSANDLRNHGANISQHLSWERTAQDFIWEIENNRKLKQFKNCKNLIVRFGIDGAILYQNQETTKAKLFYDSKFSEDGYRDKHQGDMQGFGCAFVAAISLCIAQNGIDKLDKIVKNGIIATRRLFEWGFGDVEKQPKYPGPEIFENYHNYKSTIHSINIPLNSKNEFWTILEDKTRWKLQSVAKNYVLNGDDSKLGCVPVGKFEGLKTIDRGEIESYQSIRNLMKEYLKRDNPGAPLCIGVFGPPGSGKSFGVVQLANSIDKNKVMKIEFNVSQFESTDDLIDAFHKVRDAVLKGKVPLVFFDEFDSSFEGSKLGWLKYFLAPMNDGEFKHGETMHPIGKSIFVFAGGTSDTFQDFARDGEIDPKLSFKDKEKIKEDRKGFRSAKGTDFVSRLRGHVNVMGPNRGNDDDTFYMIRRALFLRSMIERKAKNILNKNEEANIDESILRAFLKVPKYKHGVRSMGAIFEMSMLNDKKKFEQSALPPQEQLDMHVDAEIFSKLVSRDVLLDSNMEKLAREIHVDYVEEMKKEGEKSETDDEMQPWEKLKEDIKDSNRQQAEQIPEKLQAIHYDFIPTLDKPKNPRFNQNQIEKLAKMEHDRWMKERFAKGWKQDYEIEKSDHDLKLSPYLVPWTELSESVKSRDRKPVSKIPEHLEKAGFEIYSLK